MTVASDSQSPAADLSIAETSRRCFEILEVLNELLDADAESPDQAPLTPPATDA